MSGAPKRRTPEQRAEAEQRRQKRAEAAGFSSPGQQYRASKRGYTGQGAAYNAALTVAHDKSAPAVVKRRTREGVVLSAERGDFRALMRAVRREMD